MTKKQINKAIPTALISLMVFVMVFAFAFNFSINVAHAANFDTATVVVLGGVVAPGGTQAMLRIDLQDADSRNLESMIIDGGGTALEADVDRVLLYLDDEGLGCGGNGNGLFSPGSDSLIGYSGVTGGATRAFDSTPQVFFDKDFVDGSAASGDINPNCVLGITETYYVAYEMNVSATDTNTATAAVSAGNISDTVDTGPAAGSGTATATIDGAPPIFTINDGTAAGPVQTDTINITVTDTNLVASSLNYGYSPDSTCDAGDTYGNPFTNSTNFNITGDHTDYLCVVAYDQAFNMAYQLVGQLNTDNTPPAQPPAPDLNAASDTGSSSVDDITSDTTPQLDGTAEAGSTVSFTSSIDGAVGSTTAGGGVYNYSVSALSEGTHNLTVVATDAATNSSPASPALTVTIDTTAPTYTINDGTDVGPVQTDTINITVNDANLDASALDYGFSADATCDGADTYSTSFTNSTNFFISGDHTDYLCVRATDLPGFTSYQLVGQLNTDNTPPAAPSVPDLNVGSDTGASSVDDITNDATPQFDGTGEAGATITIISSVDGAIGSGPATAGNYNVTVGGMTTAGQTGTAHNITATATDAAGNTSVASAALPIVVDVTQPFSVPGAGTDPIYDGDLIQEVTYTYNEAMDPASTPTSNWGAIAGVITSNADGAWSGGNTIWTETFNITDANEDVLGVSLDSSAASDVAGNVEVLTWVTFFDVDTQNPTITAAYTQDTDGVGPPSPGIIDTYRVTFNEPVIDASYNAGIAALAISGEVGLPSFNTNHPTASVANDQYATFYFPTPLGGQDTGAIPDITTAAPMLLLDLAGNPMVTIGSGTVVETDGAPPVILSTNPVDAAASVFVNQNLIVTFSEAMSTGTVTQAQTAGPDPGGWAVAWSAGNTVATYSHNLFAYGTSYTEQITAGQDMNALGLAPGPVPNPWSFTTTAGGGGGGGGAIYPSNTSVIINDDFAETTSQIVTLAISAADAEEMTLSNDPNFVGAVWEPYANSKTWTLTDGYETKTVYANFKSTSGNTAKSIAEDSINYVETATQPEEPTEPEEPTPGEEPTYPSGLQSGDLIKGSNSPAVYILGSDGKRHVFPTDTVYFSWFKDFSAVKVISDADLAAIPLGANVTMRPGTWLVKIQSLAPVYAVEPGGVIRWIETQELAEQLYGEIWNQIIVDVSDAFWPNYIKGDGITTLSHPSGALISYAGDGNNYYMDNGEKRPVSSTVFDANMFNSDFIVQNVPTSIVYPTGADLTSMTIVEMMGL